MYVKTTACAAEIDREFLITSKDRKLASNPRSVEDPIAARAASLNVSYSPLMPSVHYYFYEENLSQRYLDAKLGSRLGTFFAQDESRT